MDSAEDVIDFKGEILLVDYRWIIVCFFCTISGFVHAAHTFSTWTVHRNRTRKKCKTSKIRNDIMRQQLKSITENLQHESCTALIKPMHEQLPSWFNYENRIFSGVAFIYRFNETFIHLYEGKTMEQNIKNAENVLSSSRIWNDKSGVQNAIQTRLDNCNRAWIGWYYCWRPVGCQIQLAYLRTIPTHLRII